MAEKQSKSRKKDHIREREQQNYRHCQLTFIIMVTTRKRSYKEQVGKARCLTPDTHTQYVEDEDENQRDVGREEERVESVVMAKEGPKFLTADKCKPDDVLMHCPWMCSWVKPVPEIWRKYIKTSPGTNYVDYLDESNIPNCLFKATNAYKRTVSHLWDCGRKSSKNRSDWPRYFDRTWKGQKLKSTKIDTAAMTSPMHRENINTERRYTTVEKCKVGDTVMKCPNVTCRYVKVVPRTLIGEVGTEVEGKLLVVKTDEEASTAVRQTSQWKRMRLHALQCADSIPTFFKERGGI